LDGRAVGACGLHGDSNANGTGSINYAIHDGTVQGEHYSRTQTHIMARGMDRTVELRIGQIML
jgi:hypothetical protein